MRPLIGIGVVLAATIALVAGLPAAASAQLTLGGFNVEGEVEGGYRFYLDRPARSQRGKFEEYRDLPENPFLGILQLRLFRPDESYSVDFGGSKWGQEDQEFTLGAGRLGVWRFDFEWNQIPHIYSTTARFLATETDRGVFVLPTPRPSPTTHNSARRLDEISTRWDTARISLVLTPTPDFDVTAEYTRIRKDGDRPFGMAFGSPGGNFYEILEPIEHTIHDFRLRAALARERWQLQFGYALSIFQNDLKAVIADNPCFGLIAVLPAGCGASDGGPTATARGQTSLPPDNMAHTVTLAGGVSLPLRTRINGNLSYSLRLQNDSFLPHTINPALAADPDLRLPQRDLNGTQHVFLVNVFANSRPFPVPLTLSAKYRFFELKDLSDEIRFPGHVVDDREPVVRDPRLAGRWEYARHNADVDARYQFIQPLAVTLGVGWERWDRNEHREVPLSDEYFAKVAVDVTPFDWLAGRLTYRPSIRRIDEYHTAAHLEHAVVEDPGAAAQGQSLLLRKFDEAERDRQQVELLLHFTPVDTLTISPIGRYRWDDYVDSILGLQREESWAVGFDVGWTPTPRLSMSLSYLHERIERRMRSRSRIVVGGVVGDFPDYDWVSNMSDTVDTITASVRTTLIPSKLEWLTSASYAFALGRIDNSNPVAPTSGTDAQNLTATAKPFPAFQDELFRLETALRYHFAKSWTATLGYAYEMFQKNDWRTDQLNPFVPGISSIWLGNNARNYDAHLMTMTVGYRFR